MNVTITDTWDSLLDEFSDERKDIYETESYVKLYENSHDKALCIVVEDREKVFIMPFLRRRILGFKCVSDDYFDFETAYGYGGPIVNTNDEKWIHKALCKAIQFFKEQKFLCGFVRFHPLLSNDKYCNHDMNVLFDRETVVINTEEEETSIWNTQINSKNRNMIRKAEKNGLIYNAEYDFKSINQFVTLYNSTMDRLKADKFYYFNGNYYRNYIQQFGGHAFLGTVRKGEELVCAALFMYSNYYGHYHLEGSNHFYSNLGANNLLLWKTSCEMHRMGVKQFHLGGGYNSDKENSLLKFKKVFSNDLRQFNIGKLIFDPSVYNEVRQEWVQKRPEKVLEYGNRLLCYRY